MAIETWQDALGAHVVHKHHPGVVMQIDHIHADWTSEECVLTSGCSWYGGPRQPAACVCKVIYGTVPPHWESCTFEGYEPRYRMAAKTYALLHHLNF